MLGSVMVGWGFDAGWCGGRVGVMLGGVMVGWEFDAGWCGGRVGV